MQTEYPGGVTGHGWGAVDQFWMGLRAAFPAAEFRIEHQIGRDDPNMCPRAAIRFSIRPFTIGGMRGKLPLPLLREGHLVPGLVGLGAL